ncbi:MAG: AAA family ATPase [Chloroflexi bacterium]|nr:AAA family ATPase [Chloroflexota bacterium]
MTREKDKALVLHLLGEPQLFYNESSLAELLAKKEQALLIYVACQTEQRFSREHLATLLWGETSQSQARYNLRRALWNLRRVLDQVGLPPESCLVAEGSWVYIPPTAPCWVDVCDFEQVLQACFQDPQSHFSPASEGIRRIRKALDLYQGDFMAGFSVLRAPNFEEWLTLERERLFLLLLRALTSLIQGFIARGERNEAIAACQRLLVLDPLQEDIHRLLMRLYWETGQRPQALRQYNTYQELLQRELGIEPLEETRDLYQRILQRETSPISTSSSLVLTSRLTPPTPPPEALPRSRLFSLLDRGLAIRLTLLSAPPGYGKTTLLAQWLADRSQNDEPPGLSFAWYKVDEADNTPFTFVEGLMAAIAQAHPAMEQALQDRPPDPINLQGDPRRAVRFLLSTLASLKQVPFVIVLDDLEHLVHPDSKKVLQYLVEHLPVNGHLYLLTRVDPDLPLPRLRVRGQLLELRSIELRFTDEEVAAFLKHSPALNLSPAEIAELTTRAEGWIAPMWLAANALSRFTNRLDDVWGGLFAYIRDEILAPQSPEMRAFLLRSAVLDQLSPSLCQAILDIPSVEWAKNPAQWLAELERRNLFLRRVTRQASVFPFGDNEAGTEPQYAYHPLFLAFLRAELAYHLSNTEIEDLHRRAAQVWEQQNNLESALFHYQKIGDESGVARLLEQIAPTYLQQGRLEPLSRWLDQLEPAVRDQHPRLTLNAGRLRQAEGRGSEARRLYQRAVAGFEAQQDNVSRGDSLLALAELALFHGRYTEGIDLAQQALVCWDEQETLRWAAGLCLIGQLEALQGNPSNAEFTLKRARQLIASRSHPLHAFRVLRAQAWVAYLQGAYHRAIALNRLAEQEAGRDVSSEIVVSFYNPMPAILREWGEGEVSWEVTHRRLKAAHQIQDHLMLSHAHIDLGNLHLDRGDFDEAENAFRQAIAETKAIGEDGLYRLCGEAYLAYTCLLQGHTTQAAQMTKDALHRCQARDADLLELTIAQTVMALAHVGAHCNLSEDYQRMLSQAYHTFERLGVNYGTFVSAVLIGLSCLNTALTKNSDQQQQARRYTAKALALAAAEGYIQTIVTARQITLPLLLFALREGIESRFVSQLLAQMGPDSLAGVVESAQDADPAIRERTSNVLEVIATRNKTTDQNSVLETVFAALEQLAQDPDPQVRAAAAQALQAINRQSQEKTQANLDK